MIEKLLESNKVSITFVQDRLDVKYSFLLDRKATVAGLESILQYEQVSSIRSKLFSTFPQNKMR